MSKVKFQKSERALIKNSDALYKSSFADLPDKTVYHDPMGWRNANGESVNLKQEMYEADKDKLDKFDEMQQKGYTLNQTIDTIQKMYDTSSWNLPTFYLPDIHVVNPERTPAADLIARETTDSKTIDVTAETDQPGIEWGIGGNSSYSYNDASYSSYTYDVKGYGVASELSDKLILANDPVRATQPIAEQANMTAIRQAEERQILFGQTDNTNWGADTSGFTGFYDWASKYGSTLDLDSSQDWESEIRGLIDSVEEAGGSRDNMAVFCDFGTHKALREELTSTIRYETPVDELQAGFETLVLDGTPILKTHAIPNQNDLESGWSNMPIAFAADMSAFSMRMLQDAMVKPLAKDAPTEKFATDAYGCLIAESKDKVEYLEGERTA